MIVLFLVNKCVILYVIAMTFDYYLLMSHE